MMIKLEGSGGKKFKELKKIDKNMAITQLGGWGGRLHVPSSLLAASSFEPSVTVCFTHKISSLKELQKTQRTVPKILRI